MDFEKKGLTGMRVLRREWRSWRWRRERRAVDQMLLTFLLFLLLIFLFIVKEQVTNDFAIVKPTKLYANLTKIPIPISTGKLNTEICR